MAPPDPAVPDLDAICRALFAAYPDALLLVDTQGRVKLANSAAAALFGYGHDELIGLGVDALVPDAARERHAGYRAAYARQPRARPMGTQELLARRRDGSEVMVEIALSPLEGLPMPLVVASVRSVASYPRVQQALRRAQYSERVAEVGRIAVDARDPHSLLRELPTAAAQALTCEQAVLYLLEPDRQAFRVAAGCGLTPEEAVGTIVPNRPDAPPGCALAEGGAVVIADYANEARFAVPPWFERLGLASGVAVALSDRGRPVGVLAVRSRKRQPFGDDELNFLRALSSLAVGSLQRAQSEEALQHAQRLESVGQLTGGVAHDFNNLLTVMLGNLQVLQELPAVAEDESAREFVDAAQRAGRRGAELTGKLLAFSRRQVLQPARVDVAALLHSLTDMLRRTIDQRIRIAVHVAPACPPLRADPGQLESALLNIAINARDAMPDGGLLSFSAAPAAGNEDRIAIAVADSGTGMPEAVRERAFEPFFTTKPHGRGTGLGLSTVYGFVRQSDGAIELDSAVGRGTTVTLSLPRWDEDEGSDGSTAADDGRTAVPPGLRMLLVEDDAEVRAVVKAFAEQAGCVVHDCADAQAALAALDAPFDVLLSDVALGSGLRGTELAQRAQRRQPGLAVLLMSGFATELLREGAPLRWEVLAKPFTAERLAQALAAAVRPDRRPA
jgi:PAS domain S-box-containing protein